MSYWKNLIFIHLDDRAVSLVLFFYLGLFWKADGNLKESPLSYYPNSIFEWKSEIGISSARIIPNNHYVSTFLNEGISKRFLYINEDNIGNVISVLVTPCTSVLLWSVKFWSSTNHNNTTMRVHKEPELLKSFRTQRSATFYDLKSRPGIYIVEIKALYSDSYVHLYAASRTEPVRIPSNFIETSDINPGVPKPKISIRRLRGQRVNVKWEASAYNPHLVKYCIVVNTRQDYNSLCEAQGMKYGVLPPDLMHVSYYYFPLDKQATRRLPYMEQNDQHDDFQKKLMLNAQENNENQGLRVNKFLDKDFGSTSTLDNHHRRRHAHSVHNEQSDSFDERERARDLIIGCVNQKTNYILDNLREGKLYYFNVFIQDSSTNFTYPYLRTTINMKYRKNLPNNSITDSKAMKLSVDETGTLVKFNVKKPCSLRMYVMPCGGTISYQLIHAYKSIIVESQTDSLDVLKIEMPEKGRYYVRLRQSQALLNLNKNNSSVVELYVNKKNKRRFPLPKLPQNTQITEDVKERTCDSVKISWYPSPEIKDNEYCIFLKEEARKRLFNFKKPNQCDVERGLNSDPHVTHSMCIQRPAPKIAGHFLSQTINGLHPDKIYVVQLILRRHKGKALSYDLMQVATSSRCTDNFTND